MYLAILPEDREFVILADRRMSKLVLNAKYLLLLSFRHEPDDKREKIRPKFPIFDPSASFRHPQWPQK